jgi:hypothetical protein
MADRVRKAISKLKNQLGRFSISQSTEQKRIASARKSPTSIRSLEERRAEALKHIVKKHREMKRREEELRKKLESYGRMQRWLYRRRAGLQQSWSFFKDFVVKPISIGLFGVSGMFSAILATVTMPRAAPLIQRLLPFPLLYYPIIFLLAICIAFSPFIVSMEAYRHVEMERQRKRLREEHGIVI